MLFKLRCSFITNIFYRADYWKSQDRKYCDFCKCWIADNRPSIDFHEKGRKHQANVSKRLKNISKQSARTQKESEKFDVTLKRIESAAQEAYQKDVQNNADISGVEINNKKNQERLLLASKNNKNAWYEARADDGRTYYWHATTKESIWEPPKEGFVSVVEQDYEKAKKVFTKQNILLEAKLKQERESNEQEERAKLAREKMKERRVVDDTPTTITGPILPSGKTEPYGHWQTVKVSTQIDLQLPQQPVYIEEPVFEEPQPEPVREFKEKIVESIEGADVGFKKRKFGCGSKRNMRQRLNDD